MRTEKEHPPRREISRAAYLQAALVLMLVLIAACGLGLSLLAGRLL